jgi:ribonuclease R
MKGLIDAGPGRAFHKMGGIPKVTCCASSTSTMRPRARPVPERWEGEGEPPRLRVMERKGRGASRARRG